MKNIENILAQSLEQVVNEFGKDELAFLALTTKIELPLRDRLAYVMYKKLKEEGLVVSREWRRVDLAVLRETVPQALIELKAMYTFDALRERGNLKKRIGYLFEDIKKASQFDCKSENIYGILLATHPRHAIPLEFTNIIKYIPGINSALKRLGDQKKVAEVSVNRIEKLLASEKHTVVKKGTMLGGSAFGIETDVLYWLIKK